MGRRTLAAALVIQHGGFRRRPTPSNGRGQRRSCMIYPTTGFQTLLESIEACPEARWWVGERSLAAAWEDCERPDWMLWLVAKMMGQEGWPEHHQTVLAVCAIAEAVLPVFEAFCPDDPRPRVALATARAWTNGKATLEEVQIAAKAAYSAADAAHTTYNARPATAAYAAFYASHSVYATSYSVAAAYAKVSTISRRALAQLVRDNLTVPVAGRGGGTSDRD